MPPNTTDTGRPPARVHVSRRSDGRSSTAPIRALMREPGFAEVEPDLPPRGFIKFVHPCRCFDVQHAQQIAQAGGGVGIGRRVGDKMIMVRKHRPCLHLPAKISGHGQQTPLQYPQPFDAVKVLRVPMGRSGNKISSASRQLVRGRVRPRRPWFGHEMTMRRVRREVKLKFHCA